MPPAHAQGSIEEFPLWSLIIPVGAVANVYSIVYLAVAMALMVALADMLGGVASALRPT